MRYSVADISVALDSVSQICDTGATVIFEKGGGRIITAGGGTKIPFERYKDPYRRRVWIENKDHAKEPTSVFNRQGPSAP